MFGLKQIDIDIINNIGRQNPEIEQIFIFGSRARGDNGRGSDVDLAITGENVKYSTISSISYWLNEQSPTPYYYDVVHLDTLKDSVFKEQIIKEKKLIYKREGCASQKLVKDFILKYNLQTSQQIRYIDLVSEVGELGKEIIKCSDYGKKDYEKTLNLDEELGDCLFSMFALCCEMGVDAEKLLAQALVKYEARFASKGDISSWGK